MLYVGHKARVECQVSDLKIQELAEIEGMKVKGKIIDSGHV